MLEKTLVLVKPDGVQRSLVGEIVSRFERVGLKIVAMKMVWADRKFAEKHYAAHADKKFFKSLVGFLSEGPVVAMVLEGLHAVEVARKLVGATEPKSAAPGTIRGDLAHHSYEYTDKKGIPIKNLIHASADNKDAAKEIALWFTPKEMHSYKSTHDAHVL